MALRPITCPSCQHPFKVPSTSAGQRPCPKCGAAVPLGETPASGGASARAGSAPRHGSGTARHHKHHAASSAARAKAGGGAKKLPFLLGGGAAVLALGLWFFLSGDDEAPKAVAAAPAPAGVDLSALPDVEPLEGTDAGDWEKMNEMMARYVAPPWGPSSAQYGDRLMIKGRYSVPAILNGFKRLDLSTPHGADVGWKIQALLLQGLCKDINYGWRRDTRPEDVAFNQGIVQRWFKAWEYAGDDDDLWAELAQNKGIPPGPKKPAAAATEGEGEESGGM